MEETRRTEKRCVAVNHHEAHDWGEIDSEFWFCPGLLTETAHQQRIADIEALAQDYEELAERVRQRQIKSLKPFFEQAYLAGAEQEWAIEDTDFEQWWQAFLKERENDV